MRSGDQQKDINKIKQKRKEKITKQSKQKKQNQKKQIWLIKKENLINSAKGSIISNKTVSESKLFEDEEQVCIIRSLEVNLCDLWLIVRWHEVWQRSLGNGVRQNRCWHRCNRRTLVCSMQNPLVKCFQKKRFQRGLKVCGYFSI